MTKEQENELRHQIAYAERQFIQYQMRVSLAIAEGKLQIAKNYLEHMTGTNDFIDAKRRTLEPGNP